MKLKLLVVTFTADYAQSCCTVNTYS